MCKTELYIPNIQVANEIVNLTIAGYRYYT